MYLYRQRQKRSLHVAEDRLFLSWLTTLAMRRGLLLSQVLAALDDDPDAMMSEIALIRLEAAIDQVNTLVGKKLQERAPAVRALKRSERFDDRLVAALYAERQNQKK